MKAFHEIRDPIHVFIRLDSDERRVLDSKPFQRLRHINQLALSNLVYPGATHKRFEHALGVMELAGRVFDTVTRQEKVNDEVRNLLPDLARPDAREYWRKVLRMAALLHDIGHLPFSHAAEKELLPNGWTHEDLTLELIRSEEIENIFRDLRPPLSRNDIEKLAVGPEKMPGVPFNNWEGILSEIIVGDAFGVDRMDYLLRDSYHTGVSYGRFDVHRLIDTLKILKPSPTGDDDEESAPVLGLEEGGVHSAEAMALARYFTYSQIYFHPVRRAYDIHLKDFMKSYFGANNYPVDAASHLRTTDNEVWVAISEASRNSCAPGHKDALRIENRQHFKRVYSRNPDDVTINPFAADAIFEALKSDFDEKLLRKDGHTPPNPGLDFPIEMMDGRNASSISISETLRKIPVPSFEYIFADASIAQTVSGWIEKNRANIIKEKQ
jgi:HD superfamily phosphohydrolase